MIAADLMTLSWAALLLLALAIGYGLGRMHERDRRRVAPVYRMRATIPCPADSGTTAVRVLPHSTPFDWASDGDGGAA